MSAFSAASLRRALAVAGYQDGQRVELAAIPPDRPGIFTLWVDVDREGLERAAGWLSPREGTQNLYLLANPLRPNAVKRRAQRAHDPDCASAELLLVDVDPVKVRQRDVDAGKAAAEDLLDELGTRPEKLEAAAAVAKEVRRFLDARLGVSPPLVSSGRGRQLWLRTDGKLDKRERKRLLRALAARFDRPGLATLDKATHNVARLMRLPGGRNLRTGERAEVLELGDGGRARAADVRALLQELEPKRRPRRPPRRQASEHRAGTARDDASRVESALAAISAEDYETWVDVGMALASSSLPDAFERWDRWSATGSNYPGRSETAAKWPSFSADGGITMGTLYHLAIEHGWTPPALDRREEELLELLDVTPRPRSLSTPDEATVHVRAVARALRRRGEAGPVVQDRRPTGSGKTTEAARELGRAAAEDGSRFLWAAPSHDLARLEALPALAKGGAAIWDEDLDGSGDNGVRAQLEALGATVLPLGEPPPAPATPVAVKVAPFSCPGPAVPGWTPESVEQLYGEAAARGWNPAATVCRGCPRFLSEDGADPCTYWERRRLAAEADLLVVPHHGLRKGSGATEGRQGVVIDEDPSGALVKRLVVDERGAKAFLVLVGSAVDYVAAETQRVQEELEELAASPEPGETLWGDPEPPTVDEVLRRKRLEQRLAKRDGVTELVLAQAETAEQILAHVLELLGEWRLAVRGGRLLDAYAFAAPDDVELEALGELADLGRACERVLRDLAKRGEHLTDRDGQRVGSARNLLPFLRELARTWTAGRAAVLHTQRRKGQGPAAVLPVVEPLPDRPVLALDATGDPGLLGLATRRSVDLIEGELTGELQGVHLVDVPCGRRRWRKRTKRAGRGGRTSSEARAADVGVIVRYARRVGAQRIGLVTFKFVRDELGGELNRRGDLEVRALHYGGEVGSNAFAGWADLVVVAGTPFVPPEEVRLRAALEGADVDELLTPPEWQLRRLPGGGTASVLTFAGAATQRAYAALVRARLEQSLGRALRWDWVPPCGVLVLAEPWPTRHSLTLSTRQREALDGPAAELVDAAPGLQDEIRTAAREGRVGDPLGLVRRWVRRLVADVGGAERAAALAGVGLRSAQHWVAGDRLPEARHVVALAEARAADRHERAAPPADRHERQGAGRFSRHEREIDMAHVEKNEPPPKTSSLWGRFVFLDMSTGIDMEKGIDMKHVDKLATELTKEAIALAGGKTRLLGEATGFSPITIRRWRNGSLEPGAKSRRALESFVAERRGPEGQPEPSGGRERGEVASDDPPCLEDQSGPPPVESMSAEALLEEVAPHVGGGQLEAYQKPGNLPQLRARVKAIREREVLEPPPGAEVLEPPTEDTPGTAIVPGVSGHVHEDLVEIPAGTDVPGMGRTYASAKVPAETAAKLSAAPPPELTKREEVARGLEELRAWVDPAKHPGWLRRAAARAKGLGSLATWLGTRRRAGEAEVDQDLALERAQGLQGDLEAPLYTRRLWGHVVAVLLKRGARPRGEHAKPTEALRARRGRLRAARKGQGADPACKACGGTGVASSGSPCAPCQAKRGQRAKPARPTQAEFDARTRVSDEPIVQHMTEALEAKRVGRRG